VARTSLDEVDRRILRLLQDDGRMTQAAIARAVGMTAPAVLERVRRLEQAGVIRGYRARLDPDQLGYQLTVLVSVTLARHGEDPVRAFQEVVATIPEIVECHHITGAADFVLRVLARDVGHYRQLLMGPMSALPAVQRVQSFVVLDTSKDAGPIPISE
jgi:Lrp/AsnC family leucine-responsive transcriptional regulator